MRNISRVWAITSALASILALSACGTTTPSTNTQPTPSASTQAGAEVTGELTVFAAASLNKSFTDLGQEFEKQHPATTIKFSFEGSKTLVEQLRQGARADVLATADEKNMEKARAAGVVDGAELFATNTLVLVTPPNNPANVKGVDESLAGVKLVICAEGVPCGNATRALADLMGAALNPVSEETKVTDVRGKVESGEADAGFIYATDAKAAGDKLHVIEVPAAAEIVNRYPIAPVKEGANPAAARAFIDFVRSPQGAKILSGYGFGTPTEK